MLEWLWKEYLSIECSKLESEEQRKLLILAGKLHEQVDATLDEQQRQLLEAYLNRLYDLEQCNLKNAFMKGCKLAATFFADTH